MKLGFPGGYARDGIFGRATPGISHAAKLIDDSINEAWLHSQQTLTSERSSLREKFWRLADEWKAAAEYESSPSRIAKHPAYQEIIRMGLGAVPLILKDLEATRAPWFWALRSITGEDPVPQEDRGYIDRMTNEWIRWGVRNSLL